MKKLLKKLIPSFLLNWYYLAWPALGALICGFPSKKLKVIGITGTNGKSTVVDLSTKILEEAGYKVASLSSIRFKIGEKEWPNTLKMTMPGRLKLQKFLKESVDAGCQYAILEVTSEGIKQYRHKFIDFDVAVLTNLTPEHIESHGSFEKYREAKGRLWESLKNKKLAKKISIVNGDDKNADYFLQFPADEKWVYKLKIKNSRGEIENQNLNLVESGNFKLLPLGSKFFIGDTEFNIKLLGEFNIYNALAAICLACSQEVDLKTSKRALEKIGGIPGRMEIVETKPFTIIVDYAHTPDALEEVYWTIQNQLISLPSQKLICVLGAAGGGRDKWKRPEFGKIASKYCDKIIITNEDPYEEDPQAILEQIYQGINLAKIGSAFKILDRREAIRQAIKLAKPKDILIITGKGCEPWLMVNGTKIPWDDREIVREELKNLKIENRGCEKIL